MNATDLAAIGEGLAAGLIAGVLFQWVGSRMPRIDFWKPAAAFARSLVAVQDDDFFARYAELLKLLALYLRRQALVLVLPVAVVTGALLFPPPETEARTPVDTPARMLSWTAPLQAVELTSLVSVCVGSGIGMTLLRKRP
jgi:hypothetical protein